MKNLLLRLLAACILISAPVATIQTADAAPKKAVFKKSHFGKKDHMKFKKVKRKKVKHKKSKSRPERKLHRYDSKKMHNGETSAYLLGIPIKKKGYKPQKFDR
jgi:hypothetical protein